ncbi:hypothetical protein PVAND_003554 [Polypedilum vanderplanki]|uniref:ELYS-like domain-containing protein n=1 Tax=Polypedilum vanderplanki TaxID=319348 RepID=A0A9J6BUW7_POLVA|nr:hypothetical protein PVAND_003554 [Polypedilum vanderplanki]
MSTTEKLELIKSINIKTGQQEPYSSQNEQTPNRLAGFLQNGKLSWIAYDAILRIISTNTGVEIAYYNFAKHNGIEGCRINYIEEIKYLPDLCIIAVSMEFVNNSIASHDAGMISIFCIQGSKILGSMDMSEHITSCKYLDWEICRRSALREFHGTLAIGTNQGKIFLVDLMIPNDINEIVLSRSYAGEIFPMVIAPMNDDTNQVQLINLHKKFINTRDSIGERSFFAIQLKQVLDDSGAIISFLCMPSLIMMATGLADGRMILYDLVDLQAFHLAYPPGNCSPLTHMSFIEPADDPRSAIYIWAFHASKDGAIAVMHSIMFENRVNGYYENFRSCSVRLTMPMFTKDTFPVCCRSITKKLSEEDEIITINLLVWTSPSRNLTNVMIFDLNQWYKEEMPSVGDWRNHLKYAVVFEVQNIALDTLLNEQSVMPFNSISRPEEHFYPNSLSFDIVVLEIKRFTHYHWVGAQNQVLQQFHIVGPNMILEPSYYFNELLQVSILPQFYDTNFSIASSIELKREFLLSVALEYNFTGFLMKCAWSWADGSYIGKDGTGVSLSTLTEWIWNRVLAIKEISNTLSQPLFDFSEQRIDCGTQKQLSMCCKQLKTLSELLQIITNDYKRFIPENIQSRLQNQMETVKMASDYQEVLQWLLNVGMLPEGNQNYNSETELNDDFIIVPYPYRTISSHYNTQRFKFNDDEDDRNNSFPCKYLFIDLYIENECNGNDLIQNWNGNYPPKTIQSLLRTLLVSNIPTENKHVILMYVFMDITNALNETPYATIVRNLIKFPAVFKIKPSTIKRTQAFWNLDNGLLDTAVEELISPLSNDRFLPKWQRELLVRALLKQNATSLALRALCAPGYPIAAELEMATLLSNNLISKALKTQRASGDRSLLKKFFHTILHSANYEQLLDLALTEDEGNVLREYLQSTDLPNSVNLHFVYLLQRAKFIDAARLMDSFNNSDAHLSMESPKHVLNAYYSVMEPTTRKLTSMAYTESQSNLSRVNEPPLPLSVSLIRSRCNATNDIYKKCVQSITEATHDTNQEVNEIPFIGMPKLGMFAQKPHEIQTQDIIEPLEFNEHGKRTKNSNNEIFQMDVLEGPRAKRRKIDEVLTSNKFKSFVDRRINLLTNFKQTRPQLNFSMKTPSSSSRVTPEKQIPVPLLFGDVLTPIVEKKTPLKILADRAATPQSILKTKSCRSSVSPAHSRYSEYDDNKSVKSITFAMPDNRDQDSSYLDESFGEAVQVNSSAEIFYSPEKQTKDDDIVAISSSSTITSGPKPRPSIKSHSRSNTPNEEVFSKQPQSISINKPIEEEEEEVKPFTSHDVRAQSTQKVFAEHIEKPASPQQIAETIESSNESENNEIFKREGILNSTDEESESSVSIPDDSIYGYVRKSVLQTTTQTDSSDDEEEDDEREPSYRRNNLQSSSSDDDDEDLQIAEDEHFEEEELPEHSDYDDYDESSSDKSPEKKINITESNEIIELLDSDDDDISMNSPKHNLPPFNQIESRQEIVQKTTSEKDEMDVSEYQKLSNTQNPIDLNESHSLTKSTSHIDPQQEVFQQTISTKEDEIEEMDILELENVQNTTELNEPSTENEMIALIYDNLEEQQNVIKSKELEQSVIATTSQIEPQHEEIDPQKVLIKEPESEENVIVELENAQNIIKSNQVSSEKDINEMSAMNEGTKNILEVAMIEEESKVEELNVVVTNEMTELLIEKEITEVSTKNVLEVAIIEEENKIENTEGIVSAVSTTETHELTIEKEIIEISTINEETKNILEVAMIEEETKVEEHSTATNETQTNEKTLDIAMIDDDKNNSDIAENLKIDMEVQEILKTPTKNKGEVEPHSSQTDTDYLSTPRRTRSVARFESETGDAQKPIRLLRATSVPSSSTSSSPVPHSRSSRASSELRTNPKAMIKEKMLESIAESPVMLTRSKVRMLNESRGTTPQTPNSRAPSEDQDSVKKTPRRRRSSSSTPITPRRILTRASSVASSTQIDGEKTPEEPTKSNLRNKKSKMNNSDDEGEDTKSLKSNKSTSSSRKKNTSSSNTKNTPNTSPIIDELNQNTRRLTRGQLAVLEKSREVAQRLSSSSQLRRTVSDYGSRGNIEENDSDNESVKSEKSKDSKKSSRRGDRKRKLPSHLNDFETSSNASSRKSKSPKKHQDLSVIPEENETPSVLERSTRSQKKK